MNPTWESDCGTVKLWLGDCLDVMQTWPDGAVDAVVTDPPFFMPAMHYQSRVQWQRKWADTSPLRVFFSALCDASIRTMSESPVFFTFCNADAFACFYPEVFSRFSYSKSLVWDKTRVGLGSVWRNQHELIICGRSTTIDGDGELRGDVLCHAPTPSASRTHPVEKPPALLADLIAPLRSKTIADPFMGSGTTGVAAVRLGRKFMGVEIDPQYFEVAKRRIQDELDKVKFLEPPQTTKQQELFA